MHSIPEYFRKKIQEAKEKQLKELNLRWGFGTPDDQKLAIVPDAVLDLGQLEVLNLRNNRLTHLPEAIAQLHNLKSLDLSSNKLTAVPEAIARLHNLRSLDLSDNKLTTIRNPRLDFQPKQANGSLATF